jgi:hypothetical protein
MQQKDEPILARPGRSPTYLVGVTGLLYLGVGGVIAYAYCVGRNAAFGPEVFWERVPANALWLVPGLALLASVGFVRRHNWLPWCLPLFSGQVLWSRSPCWCGRCSRSGRCRSMHRCSSRCWPCGFACSGPGCPGCGGSGRGSGLRRCRRVTDSRSNFAGDGLTVLSGSREVTQRIRPYASCVSDVSLHCNAYST